MDFTPPDILDSSYFDSLSLGRDASEMSLSDLEGPPRKRGAGPPLSARVTLLARHRVEDEPENESLAVHGQEQDDEEEEADEHIRDINSTPNGPAKQAADTGYETLETPAVTQRQPISEEDSLRRQLSEMQQLNAAFMSYYNAVGKARDQQKALVRKVETTKGLLDRYVAILGQAEQNARLLLDPSWDGAQADEERIREQVRREEQERRERDAVIRLEAHDRARKDAEAAEAATLRAATVRGRGITRALRGRGAVPATGRAVARLPSATSGRITPGTSLRGRVKVLPPSGIRPPSVRGVVRGSTRGARGA